MNRERLDRDTSRLQTQIPGTIRKKQNGLVALRLHAVGGEFSAAQMRAIADVAERFGRGRLRLSTRQGIEIHFVHATDAGEPVGELESAGMTMGADGPRVRSSRPAPAPRPAGGGSSTRRRSPESWTAGTSPRRPRTSS